jgi:hypothetical protein
MPSNKKPSSRKCGRPFKKATKADMGTDGESVLPIQNIDRSLQPQGAQAYEAVLNGTRIGGDVINIDKEYGGLDFLYVKGGAQSKGESKNTWVCVTFISWYSTTLTPICPTHLPKTTACSGLKNGWVRCSNVV